MRERVFITGGASGLGKALALKYAQRGSQVCIGDINPDRGAEVARQIEAAGGRALYRHCDVRQVGDLEAIRDALQQQWGGVDVVINNAGVADAGSIEDTSLADWEWILDINLLGVVRGCKVFTPVMRKQHTGTIVNIASAAGLMMAPLMDSYNVSKAGVIALSETLRHELVDTGIHVVCACPAFFQTNLASSIRSPMNGIQQSVNKLMKHSKIGADDVAQAIVDAVRDRQFWVMPHQRERHLWHLKRYAPWAFELIMQKGSRVWIEKMLGQQPKTKK
jgi:NAD(P)-dependent dehydrogenase (short-subunit alcohol dehydrogenase family)